MNHEKFYKQKQGDIFQEYLWLELDCCRPDGRRPSVCGKAGVASALLKSHNWVTFEFALGGTEQRFCVACNISSK